MSTLVKKLYTAGPMTGIPKFNFPAFLAAAEDLRKRGYEIISPAEMDLKDVGTSALASPDGKLTKDGKTTDGYTFGDFLARDVKIIADQVDGVVCLPGWDSSKGARLEVFVALISGKPVYTYMPTSVDGMIPMSFARAAHIVMPRDGDVAAYNALAFSPVEETNKKKRYGIAG